MTAATVSVLALIPLTYILSALAADRRRLLGLLDVRRIRAGFGKPMLALTMTPHQHPELEATVKLPIIAKRKTPPIVEPAVLVPSRPKGYRGRHRQPVDQPGVVDVTGQFRQIIRDVQYVEAS